MKNVVDGVNNMDKIEQISKTVVETTHHFYCDNCSTYLGVSQEYDDGYYEKFGEFELKIHLPDGWYESQKCLCEVCKQEYLEDVRDSLRTLGFIKR